MVYPPIFVINMAKAKDRMFSMKSQLDAQGLPFERIEAVDGSKLDVQQRREQYSDWWYRLFHGSPMSNGNLGCTLSHRKIYKKIVDEKIEWAIILEDDAVLDADFAGLIGDIEKHTRDFDMMQLYSFRLPTKQVRVVGDTGLSVMRYANHHSSTAAYALRNRGARKLLTLAKVRTMPDRWCWMSAMTGLKCCAIYPYPVSLHEELSVDSTIGTTDDPNYSNAGFKRQRQPFWRIFVLPWLDLLKVGILRMRDL
jgi:glycosyl transferase, family 25